MSSLDGHIVDQFEGRFNGLFDIEQEEGEQVFYDNQVSFFVTATVDKANFATTKGGELKRTNIFNVKSVKLLPSDKTHVDTSIDNLEPIKVNDAFEESDDIVQELSTPIVHKDKTLNDFLYSV